MTLLRPPPGRPCNFPGKERHEIECRGVVGICLDDLGVWVVDTAGELVRIDPTTNEIAARIPVSSGGADRFDIDLAKGLVWVTKPFDDKAFAVDPALNDWERGVDRVSNDAGFAP